jgi:hypothetical protein
MDKRKRIIIIGYFVAILFSVLIVPWKLEIYQEKYSYNLDLGYSFIFSPPQPVATIDYGILLLEVVAITATAGIFYFMPDRVKTESIRNLFYFISDKLKRATGWARDRIDQTLSEDSQELAKDDIDITEIVEFGNTIFQDEVMAVSNILKEIKISATEAPAFSIGATLGNRFRGDAGLHENALKYIKKLKLSPDRERLMEQELYLLRAFAMDFSTHRTLGNTREKTAVLDAFYLHLRSFAVNNKRLALTNKRLEKRLQRYKQAVTSTHHLGPFYEVGKEFARACGYKEPST